MTANRVAKWDGASWSSLGEGVSGEVYAICSFGGYVVVGGAMGGHVHRHSDIRGWTSLGSGTDDNVYAVEPSGGAVFIAGRFAEVGALQSLSIAQWGSSDEDHHVPAEFSTPQSADYLHFGAPSWPVQDRYDSPRSGEGVRESVGPGTRHPPSDSVFVAPGDWGEVELKSDALVLVGTPGATRFSTIRSIIPPGYAGADAALHGIVADSVVGVVENLWVRSSNVGPIEIEIEDIYAEVDSSATGSIVVESAGYFGTQIVLQDSFCEGIDVRGSLSASRSVVFGDVRNHHGSYGETGTAVDLEVHGNMFLRGDEGFDCRGAYATRCVVEGDVTMVGASAGLSNSTVSGDVLLEGSQGELAGNPVRCGDARLFDCSVKGTVTLKAAYEIRVRGLWSSELTMGALWAEFEGRDANVSGVTISGPGSAGVSITGSYTSVVLDSSTVHGSEGAGISFAGEAESLSLSRAIVAQCGVGVEVLDETAVGALQLACMNVVGNGVDWVGTSDPDGQEGNFSEDPLFCDPENGDYTLAANSPCLPGNHPDGYDCGLIGALGEGCEAARPDLFPELFICTPDTAAAWYDEADSLMVGAVITNAGNVPAGPFDVRIEVDGCVGFWGDDQGIAELAPGAQDTVYAGPFGVLPAQCTASVWVDQNGDVDEADETNNNLLDQSVCVVLGTDGPGTAVLVPRAYPVPTRGALTIATGLATPTIVEVFDGAGRLVRKLEATRSVTWDGRSTSGARVADGIYFVRVPERGFTERVVVLR